MTVNDTYIPLDDCDILAISHSCILIGYKSKTYWVPKQSIKEYDQFNKFGISHITIWVTNEYAQQEGLLQ